MKHAIQTMKKNSKGQWLVSRQGFCPEHPKEGKNGILPSPGKYIAPQRHLTENTLYMTFRCPERGGHTYNNFWPKGAPLPNATLAEVELWKQTQIALAVVKPTKNQS